MAVNEQSPRAIARGRGLFTYRIDHVTAEDMRLYILRGCGLPEAQPRDKTVSKEDILGAYPPLGRGLSDLSHYCACA